MGTLCVCVRACVCVWSHLYAGRREVEYSVVEWRPSLPVQSADISTGGREQHSYVGGLVGHHGPVQWAEALIILGGGARVYSRVCMCCHSPPVC